MFRCICNINDYIQLQILLSVIFLQKEANIKNKLRVVPLFETLDDLINAKEIMENYFHNHGIENY